MNIDKKAYKKYAGAHAPASPIVKNCIFAFLIGGTICTIGQFLLYIFRDVAGLAQKDAGTLTSVTLIFIAVTLSGFGIFERIAKRAGGGTLVPITGFANSVVSPAIDAKAEGLVNGYRVLTNCGEDGCQTVKHLHFHLVGGKKLPEQMA